MCLLSALTLPFIHCQQSSFASKNERTRPMLESGYLHQSFRTPIEEEPLLFLKIHAYLDAENIPSFKILSKNGSSMKMTRKMVNYLNLCNKQMYCEFYLSLLIADS